MRVLQDVHDLAHTGLLQLRRDRGEVLRAEAPELNFIERARHVGVLRHRVRIRRDCFFDLPRPVDHRRLKALDRVLVLHNDGLFAQHQLA